MAKCTAELLKAVLFGVIYVAVKGHLVRIQNENALFIHEGEISFVTDAIFRIK